MQRRGLLGRNPLLHTHSPLTQCACLATQSECVLHSCPIKPDTASLSAIIPSHPPTLSTCPPGQISHLCPACPALHSHCPVAWSHLCPADPLTEQRQGWHLPPTNHWPGGQDRDTQSARPALSTSQYSPPTHTTYLQGSLSHRERGRGVILLPLSHSAITMSHREGCTTPSLPHTSPQSSPQSHTL